jgi:hypothetical protein
VVDELTLAMQEYQAHLRQARLMGHYHLDCYRCDHHIAVESVVPEHGDLLAQILAL